jgi:hypothetical protein
MDKSVRWDMVLTSSFPHTKATETCLRLVGYQICHRRGSSYHLSLCDIAQIMMASLFPVSDLSTMVDDFLGGESSQDSVVDPESCSDKAFHVSRAAIRN